jgi:hypothetical protein
MGTGKHQIRNCFGPANSSLSGRQTRRRYTKLSGVDAFTPPPPANSLKISSFQALIEPSCTLRETGTLCVPASRNFREAGTPCVPPSRNFREAGTPCVLPSRNFREAGTLCVPPSRNFRETGTLCVPPSRKGRGTALSGVSDRKTVIYDLYNPIFTINFESQ